jgi:hypothetical protein
LHADSGPHPKRVKLNSQHEMTNSPSMNGGSELSGLKPTSPTTSRPASANGVASTAHLGSRGLVDRQQYIRLLEQALSSLGFTEVAQQLEAASGIASQPPQVRLSASCLHGQV